MFEIRQCNEIPVQSEFRNFFNSKLLHQIENVKRFCLNVKASKLKSELNQEILLRVLTWTVNWKANNWFNILRLSVFFSSQLPAGRRHATHKTFSSLFSFNYTLFSFSLSIPRLRAFFAAQCRYLRHVAALIWSRVLNVTNKFSLGALGPVFA